MKDASKTADIPGYMEKGEELYEMQTFDRHLFKLVKEDKVDIGVAKLAANNPEELERDLLMDGSKNSA